MRVVALLAAVLSVGCIVDVARAQDAGDEESGAFSSYSEIDVVEGAYFISTEIYAALKGTWSRPGFILHAYFGAGQYDYPLNDVRGGKVDAVPISADLMIGYYGLLFGQTAYWDVLVGVGVENNELSPNDPSNPVRGSEVGFKVAAEIEADDEQRFYYHLEGDYTTAFDTYWSRARIGHNFGKLIVGPEGTLFGDKTFDSQRIGGFFRFPLRLFRNFEPAVIVASGYEFVHENDVGPGDVEGFGGVGGSGNGPYGTVSLEFDF
jgi:Cellulose biosynthesis protein BcsS